MIDTYREPLTMQDVEYKLAELEALIHEILSGKDVYQIAEEWYALADEDEAEES